MEKIVLATTNKGKLAEFNEMAKGSNFEFVLIDMPEIDENGVTFEQNSFIKAKEVSKYTDLPVVSDDSGLIVNCLPDMLGVHTARFANEFDTYEKRCEHLINLVNEKNESREAHFVCVITLYYKDGTYYQFKGETYGKIAMKLEGNNGHGYDPVFFSDELNMTFGSASMEQKDMVSHRAKAFNKLKEFLNDKI